MTPKRLSIRRPWIRLCLASALFSAWMLFLLVGWAAWGAVHLLLVAALVLFPWRDGVPENQADETSGAQTSSSSQPDGDS